MTKRLWICKYNLASPKVVSGEDQNNIDLKEAYVGNGKIVNSDFLNARYCKAEKIVSEIEKKEKEKKGIVWLKDWGISRQDIGVVLFQWLSWDGTVTPVKKWTSCETS